MNIIKFYDNFLNKIISLSKKKKKVKDNRFFFK